MSKIRTYSEMVAFDTFKERFNYLALKGVVGRPTFGSERYLNQRFYTSREWRQVRYQVIARDQGCDLGMDDHEIHEKVFIHHMNPMTVEDIEHSDDSILDPEYLITVTHRTHNAIHYGDESLLPQPFVERRPGDTTLWAPISRR